MESHEASPRVQPDDGAIRAYLFADLRGYTSFVERHGDHAAAALLGRYRALVRGVVATRSGAEIRTEGDSFYIVFEGVASAVMCGVELVERATAEAPPISVGVGIHAGATLEEAEGYVGSAVNLAARLCSQAGSGEVLISDTVRSLVRTSVNVRFEDRGRHRLKGISERVRIFSVARTSAQRKRRMAPIVAIGLAALGFAVLAAAVFLRGPGSTPGPSASSPSSADASMVPLGADGVLVPGNYRTDHPWPVTFALDAEWIVEGGGNPAIFVISAPDIPGATLSFTVFRNAIDPADPEGERSQAIGQGLSGVIEWLATHPYLTLEGAPAYTRFANGLGRAIDVRTDVPPEALNHCGGTCYRLFQFTEACQVLCYFWVAPDGRYRFVLVEVDDDVAVAIIETERAEDWDAFVERAQRVIASLRLVE